jgi:hypothetical protein
MTHGLLMLEMAQWAERIALGTLKTCGAAIPSSARGSPVDPPMVLRQFTRTQQVPLAGIQRELGFKARAALATVRGALYIQDH